MGRDCKRPVRAVLEYHGGTIALQAWLHPRGCMGARITHVDVSLPRDPCGLLEYYRRRGGRVRARWSSGVLTVEFSAVLGYPCVLHVWGVPRGGGWVYVMVSRSGRLYIGLK